MSHQKDSATNTGLEVYLLHWTSSFQVKHAPDESVRREKKASPELWPTPSLKYILFYWAYRMLIGGPLGQCFPGTNQISCILT
jgi:hypothetical protein